MKGRFNVKIGESGWTDEGKEGPSLLDQDLHPSCPVKLEAQVVHFCRLLWSSRIAVTDHIWNNVQR